MSDREFEINGRKFKLSKLDTFKQFHIARRVGPILSELLPAFEVIKKLNDQSGISEGEKLESIAQAAGPVMKAIAKLSDADADFVLLGLLQAVEVQQAAGNWARVSSGTMMMIQDFDLSMLMQLAGKAFMYNLAAFFPALPR